MKRAWLTVCVLGFGCGPGVLLFEDTDGGETETETDGQVPIGSTTVSEDSGGVGSAAAVTGIPPMPTTFPGTDGGFESSGFGSSGPGFVEQCWNAEPLFQVPEQARLVVGDQNGDAIDELWISFSEQGPGSVAELFQVDQNGVPDFAGEFPGFFSGLHDIDGDGVLDGVGLVFGGGPPRIAFTPGAPNFISGEPIEVNLNINTGFEAFVDVDGDGDADFFQQQAGGDSNDLRLGDGFGGFLLAGSMQSLGTNSGLSAMPVENSELVVLMDSESFDAAGACINHPFYGVEVDSGEPELQWLASGSVFGTALRVEGDGAAGEAIAYERFCSADGSLLQVNRYDGDLVTTLASFSESSFVAVGNFAGEGQTDAALGRNGAIELVRGTGPGSFGDAELGEVEFGQPLFNRVYVLDIDADGRDEIILGTTDEGSEIVYVRLDLENC